MPAPEQIELGRHVVDVYPQRQAYLSNRLSKTIKALIAGGEGISGASILSYVQDAQYEALTALIPTVAERLPEYEFMGYRDAATYEKVQAIQAAKKDANQLDFPYEGPDEADLYDEAHDHSPTVNEIWHAFEVGADVNGLEKVKRLVTGIGLDPTLLKNVINQRVAQAAQAESTPSQTSPSTSGTSALKSSTPKPRTSGRPKRTPGSLTLVSTDSSMRTTTGDEAK